MATALIRLAKGWVAHLPQLFCPLFSNKTPIACRIY